MEASFIPVSEPDLGGNEKQYVLECLETGWISSEGPFVKRFEESFAAQCGRKHGVAVSNGTAALITAIRALDLSPGDEVILPAFTIISCALAVLASGLTPVFVDVEAETWNIDPARIEEKITPRTKAILVVHIYGLPAEMNAIMEIAERHGLYVVEDAAEAHGQTYYGKPCGSFGAISVFSFYANKLVTTGEGGMILTDSEDLAGRCRSLCNLCFQRNRRFVHEEAGYNFRLTNIQAAIGVAQLERLGEFARRKRAMGTLYARLLADTPGLEHPPKSIPSASNIYWVYGVVLSDKVPFDAPEMMDRLKHRGIGTRPFFRGLHEQPVFQKMEFFRPERHPVTERISRRGFYLPGGLTLTEAQQHQVSAAVKEALHQT